MTSGSRERLHEEKTPPPHAARAADPPPPRLRPAGLPQGANLATVDGIDAQQVRALFASPLSFVSMAQIVREDESVGYLDPTPIQRLVLHAMAEHRWLQVVKHRQAKVTTIAALTLLRDCMYLNGIKGALIAETQATAEDVFERMVYAYNHLPKSVRMPLAPGRKPGARSLAFVHGGGIKVLTAGSRAPAVGRSIDRLVITEFGEAAWQKKAAVNIFPTINKRPHARVVLESTPGMLGSYFETMWHSALEGKSRFHPLFLRWWTDESCGVKGEVEELDDVERALQRAGASPRALAFRREAIHTEFAGDARLFLSKYPTDPYDGWVGSRNPVMPADVIVPALEKAQDNWREVWSGLASAAPDAALDVPPGLPGRVWRFLTIDPASYGQKGDPSALICWVLDEHSLRDELVWSDREDPGRLARRVRELQEKLSWTATEETGGGTRTRTVIPLVIVESNAPACVQSLKDLGTPNLYWTDRNHPGWYATAQRLQVAEARLIRGLREGGIHLRHRPTLHQLLSYDGANRGAHGRDEAGAEHHFDLARCAVMGAHVLGERRRWIAGVGGKDAAPGMDPPDFSDLDPEEPEDWTVKDFDQAGARAKARRKQPWMPASVRFGRGDG